MSIIVDNHIQNDLSVNGPLSFTSKYSHKLSEIHKKRCQHFNMGKKLR